MMHINAAMMLVVISEDLWGLEWSAKLHVDIRCIGDCETPPDHCPASM